MTEPKFDYKLKGHPSFIDRKAAFRTEYRDYLLPEARRWLDENCEKPWFYCPVSRNLFFESQTDGAFFRLTWL